MKLWMNGRHVVRFCGGCSWLSIVFCGGFWY